MTRVFLFALAIAASAAGASAGVRPAGRGTEETRAILTVIINKIELGESVVVLRDAGAARDVLLPAKMLADAGFKSAPRKPETIDGQIFESLFALAPAVRFEVDDIGLELRVTADASLFRSQIIDLRPHEPAGTFHTSNLSTFLNYGVNWSGSARPSIFGELGASLGSASFLTTMSRDATGIVRRGLSTMNIDRRASMRRLAFGDAGTRGGPLWSAGLVTGLSVSKEFSLNPYFVRFPTPQLSQTLTTPSTVDVFVNDRLVRRTELAPGTFDITGIPGLAGSGNTRVVVRDALGRSQEFNTNYYITAAVLSRGLSDFQYAGGYRQRLTADGIVREPAAMLSHRVGVTDRITVGAHLEGDRALVSAGPTITARPGRLGEIEAALGVSRLADRTLGRAASLAWAYSSRPISVSASIHAASGTFVSLGDPQPQNRARLEWLGALSAPLRGLGMVSLQGQQSWLPPGTGETPGSWRRAVSFSGNRRLVGRAQMQWRAGRTWTAQSHSFEASLGASITFGRTLVLAEANTSGDRATGDVMLSRAASGNRGLGYRARTDLDGGSIDGAIDLQNSVGRVEVHTANLDGAVNTSTSVSGGLVLIGGVLKPTSTLGQSYALVRVPGVQDVRVFSNNVAVGRTDRRGELLIPNLIPHYANRLAIADDDLPGDRTIADAEKLIAPPIRAGAVVTFAEERVQAAAGVMQWRTARGETISPAYGLLVVQFPGRKIESAIGASGEFFLEQLPSGRYDAEVRFHGESCLVAIVVPERKGVILDLGRLTCQAGK